MKPYFMATYYAIFTIEGGTNQDYINLKRLLQPAGFYKIISADDTRKYVLPPHTYKATTDRDAAYVCDIGGTVVKRFRKRYSIFVVQSAGTAWVGLEPG